MAKMRAKQKKRATARAARAALATLAPKRPNPADDTRRNREYTRRLVREGDATLNQKITNLGLLVAELELKVRNLEHPDQPKET